MKRITIVVLVVLLGGILYFYLSRDAVDESQVFVPSETESDGEIGSFRPDPQNATFIFEDGSITLEKGRARTEVGPGGFAEEDTILSTQIGYGDLNNDKKTDAAVILTRQGAGSGSFVYVGAFVSGLVTYKGTNTIFLGDRIVIQSITANNGVVRVNYLDRREDEPLAAEPTTPVTKEFVYRAEELQEL